MSTFSDIKTRVQELMSRKGKGSITVEETFEVLNELIEKTEAVDTNQGRLSIRRAYASIAAMNADVAPTDQETGKKLKYGELVSIANAANLEDGDNGKVYRWLNSGWEIVCKLGNTTADGLLVNTALLKDSTLTNSQQVAVEVDRMQNEKGVQVTTSLDNIDRCRVYEVDATGKISYYNRAFAFELAGIIVHVDGDFPLLISDISGTYTKKVNFEADLTLSNHGWYLDFAVAKANMTYSNGYNRIPIDTANLFVKRSITTNKKSKRYLPMVVYYYGNVIFTQFSPQLDRYIRNSAVEFLGDYGNSKKNVRYNLTTGEVAIAIGGFALYRRHGSYNWLQNYATARTSTARDTLVSNTFGTIEANKDGIYVKSKSTVGTAALVIDRTVLDSVAEGVTLPLDTAGLLTLVDSRALSAGRYIMLTAYYYGAITNAGLFNPIFAEANVSVVDGRINNTLLGVSNWFQSSDNVSIDSNKLKINIKGLGLFFANMAPVWLSGLENGYTEKAIISTGSNGEISTDGTYVYCDSKGAPTVLCVDLTVVKANWVVESEASMKVAMDIPGLFVFKNYRTAIGSNCLPLCYWYNGTILYNSGPMAGILGAKDPNNLSLKITSITGWLNNVNNLLFSYVKNGGVNTIAVNFSALVVTFDKAYNGMNSVCIKKVTSANDSKQLSIPAYNTMGSNNGIYLDLSVLLVNASGTGLATIDFDTPGLFTYEHMYNTTRTANKVPLMLYYYRDYITSPWWDGLVRDFIAKSGVGAGYGAMVEDCKTQYAASSIYPDVATSTYKKNHNIIHISDLHNKGTNALANLDEVLAVAAQWGNFDYIIHTGDICNGSFDRSSSITLAEILEVVTKMNSQDVPVLNVIGNHDSNINEAGAPNTPGTYTNAITKAGQYTALIQPLEDKNGSVSTGKTYYHHDNLINKIRTIVLDFVDYPIIPDSTDSTQLKYAPQFYYSQAQLEWLYSTLLNTPLDYAIIVAIHSLPANDYMMGLMPQGAGLIPSIINAWKNGTSYTHAWDGSGQPDLATNKVFVFTSRGQGEFICYLCGHLHTREIISADLHPDQKIIASPCLYTGGCAEGSTTYNKGKYHHMARVTGGISQNSFNIISVNRVAKKIILIAYGGYQDAYASCNRVSVISY